MASSGRRRRVLGIVATDRTFELVLVGGRSAWAGKCIHCSRRLLVAPDGELLGSASVEHIVPRTRGGTDDPENLALACAACNAEKDVRHDRRSDRDPRAGEVIARLKARRRERWRGAAEPDRDLAWR